MLSITVPWGLSPHFRFTCLQWQPKSAPLSPWHSYSRYFHQQSSDHKSFWDRYLPLVYFAYNTVDTSIGKAPFVIVEGGKKVPPILCTKDKIFEANHFVEDLATSFAKKIEALQKSQERNKKAADKHRRQIDMKEGDWVLLKFEKSRFRKKKGKERLYPKVSVRYYNTFQIVERINEVSFKLQLPETRKIHNAFHVSLLRPFKGEVPEDMIADEQPYVEETEEILQPEPILAHKERKVKGKLVRKIWRSSGIPLL
ncbi:hypothetical protein L7F22_007436 [Adiantum nelumboides]|nr:hypothetical protein [Adiantum nelumboides]